MDNSESGVTKKDPGSSYSKNISFSSLSKQFCNQKSVSKSNTNSSINNFFLCCGGSHDAEEKLPQDLIQMHEDFKRLQKYCKVLQTEKQQTNDTVNKLQQLLLQSENYRTAVENEMKELQLQDSANKHADDEKDYVRSTHVTRNSIEYDYGMEEDQDSISLMVRYISVMDEQQLYFCWDKTAHDLNIENIYCQVEVFSDGFFPKLMENIIELATNSAQIKWEIEDMSLVTAHLASIVRRGYSNDERVKKELFRFQDSNEITRLEFGLYFISLMIDPECETIAKDMVFLSLCIAPSFIPSYLNSRRKLDNRMIDEVVARIAMAVHSKRSGGMRIGSILLDFNCEQRSIISGKYNSNMLTAPLQFNSFQVENAPEAKVEDFQSEDVNAFTQAMQSLKSVSKHCKGLLTLLQFSRAQMDMFWLTEACKLGKIEVIYEILATRTSSQLMKCNQTVRIAIIEKYAKDSKFLYMANKLFDGSREQSLYFSERECFQDAEMLYSFIYPDIKFKASADKNVSEFAEIYDFLCDRSWAHIRCTSDIYLSLAKFDLGSDLVRCLKQEQKFKYAVEFAKVIMDATQDIINFFTKVLTASMEGLSINTFDFNRVLLSRCEIDLAAINYRFSTCKEFGNGSTILNKILNGKGINFPVYRSLILQLFGIGNNSQASLYELKHYSLTVWNPCSLSAGVCGKTPDFNAKNKIVTCVELIKDCNFKTLDVNDEKLKLLCMFLCEMNLGERCEMNDAYSSGDILEEFERLVIADRNKKKYVEKWDKVQNFLSGFFEPLAIFDAYCISNCLRDKEFAKLGFIIACRTDEEIHAISNAYQKIFSQSLLQFAVARCKSANKNTCSDIFEKLLSYKRSGENPSIVDYSAVHLDCVSLINPPKNRSRKMEIVRVLCTRTWRHIRCVNDHYNRMSDEGNLEKLVISSSNSGESIQVLLCLLKYSINPVSYFADSLISFGNGSGDSWLDVGRLIIPQSEIDMKSIDLQYSLRRKNKGNVQLLIEKECSNCPPLVKCMLNALLQARDRQRYLKFQNNRETLGNNFV